MTALEQLQAHRSVCATCEAWMQMRLTILLAWVIEERYAREPVPPLRCETGARLFGEAFEASRPVIVSWGKEGIA